MSATCQGCGIELPPSKNPGNPRKWCSARCRKASYGDPCVDCGTRTSHGAERARIPEPRCLRCAAVRRGNRALIERLWAEGKTGAEIARSLGWTSKNPWAIISTLRNRQGYDLPHRRTPAQLARITAGADERMAKARATARRNRERAAA